MTTDDLVQQALDKLDALATALGNLAPATNVAEASQKVDEAKISLASLSEKVDTKTTELQTSLAATAAAIASLLSVFQQFSQSQGQLNTVLMQPFVCQCSKMKLALSCIGADGSDGRPIHDGFQVTYAGLGLNQ